MTISPKISIGAQGWNYDGWVGHFYPRGTRKEDMLSLYARVFDTVEVDSTFYAIPAENAVKGWRAKTPAGFTFSLKLPAEITHKNRLRDSRDILLAFAERARLLGDRLGCVLIQLPPDFSPAEGRALAQFLELLPSDIKFAVEFRDPAWLSEKTVSLLNAHHVALTLADGKWISHTLSIAMIPLTTMPFTYVRWLGPRELTDFSHIQIDKSRALQAWAEAFAELSRRGTEVYGYFNNHYQGHSPASINLFKELIGLPTTHPDSLIVQPTLF